MEFTNRIKAEEFAISESNKRWNTYFYVIKNDDNYKVDRYWAINLISFALKGKLILENQEGLKRPSFGIFRIIN